MGDWGGRGGGDSMGLGRLQRPKNQGIQMDNSRRLGETAMDRGNYGDYGDQGIWGTRVDNSGRLGETARDWGEYRDQGT